jgi:hypothetical protein
MTQNIQFNRGPKSNRLSQTFDVGEPAWITDSKKLYIGDGSTAGGIGISMDSDISDILNGTTKFTHCKANEISINNPSPSSTTFLKLNSTAGNSAVTQYMENSVARGQCGYSNTTSSVILHNIVTDEFFKLLDTGGALLDTDFSTYNIAPYTDDTYDLGSTSYRWDDIYATNNVIQTSDETKKENITSLDSTTCKDFVNLLNPVSFKWKDVYEEEVTEEYIEEEIVYEDVVIEKTIETVENGNLVRNIVNETISQPVMIELPVVDSLGNPIMKNIGVYDEELNEYVTQEVQEIKLVPQTTTVTKTRTITPLKDKQFIRKHYGFTAQQLKTVMDSLGISTNDCAAYIDSNGDLGIRSLELLPILWKEVQRLQSEVELLKSS